MLSSHLSCVAFSMMGTDENGDRFAGMLRVELPQPKWQVKNLSFTLTLTFTALIRQARCDSLSLDKRPPSDSFQLRIPEVSQHNPHTVDHLARLPKISHRIPIDTQNFLNAF